MIGWSYGQLYCLSLKSVESFLSCVFAIMGFSEMLTLISSSSSWWMTVDFYQECLSTFFHLSFFHLIEVCQCHMLEYSPKPWCSHLQTSLLVWYFCGDMHCLLTSRHGGCYGICPDYYPSISQTYPKLCQYVVEVLHEFIGFTHYVRVFLCDTIIRHFDRPSFETKPANINLECQDCFLNIDRFQLW